MKKFVLRFWCKNVEDIVWSGLVKADSFHEAANILAERYHGESPTELHLYKLDFYNNVYEDNDFDEFDEDQS
jgi:hypothetical protein